MWNLFSSNGSQAEDLAKENKRLSEHLAIILEDYELLKEAHRRVLEQMLPMPALSPHSSEVMSRIEVQLGEIGRQARSLEDSPTSKSLRLLIEGDLHTFVLQCSKERQSLAELKEALRLKQEEIAEQEFDLSHALHELRCRETESTLEQAIQQNVDLMQTIDKLKQDAKHKDTEIAKLALSQPAKDEERFKRALHRLSSEISDLKSRCRFDVFSKQLSSTKEFLTTELQRLSRRAAGVFKEKQKLQERLDTERKSWRDTESSLRSNYEFELEQLRKRVNKTTASCTTQTEHYFEDVDTQQSEMWGADLELDWTPEGPQVSEGKEEKREDTAPVKQTFVKKKPQAGSDDLTSFLSELT